jgi:hypothetical protein
MAIAKNDRWRRKKLARRKQRKNDREAERQLRRLLNSSADIEFNEAETVVRDEIGRSEAHAGTISQRYSDLTTRLKDVRAGRAQGYEQGIQAATSQFQQVAQALQALGPEAAQAAQAQAAGTAGEQQQLATREQANRVALLGELGHAAVAQEDVVAPVVEKARLEALEANDSYRAGLVGKRKDLKRQRGAFKTKLLGDLRREDASNQIARESLDLKQTDSDRSYTVALQKLALGAEELAIDDENADADRSSRETMNEEDNATSRANAKKRGKGGKKDEGKRDKNGLTAAQRREIRTFVGKVGGDNSGLVAAYRKGYFKDKKKTHQVRKELRAQGYDDFTINIVADLAIKGYVSGPNLRAIKDRFGYIPKRYRRASGGSRGASDHPRT